MLYKKQNVKELLSNALNQGSYNLSQYSQGIFNSAGK